MQIDPLLPGTTTNYDSANLVAVKISPSNLSSMNIYDIAGQPVVFISLTSCDTSVTPSAWPAKN